MKSKHRSWKRWALGIGIVILLILFSAYIYLRLNTYEALPEAASSLEDDTVSQEDDWIKITPDEIIGQIVLYQGGLVENAAYLPLAMKLSEQGYQVFIPDMPVNLAILDTDAIEEIKEANPSEKEWWLAGHSLGGASAAIYAEEHAEQIDGLVFLAAYPSDNSDLSDSDLSILSITGSQDGILDTEQFEQTKRLLPEETVYAEIEGGNHSNFGAYGFQEGDRESDLSRKEQHEEIVRLINDFITSEGENID
ncbi:Alpha/beta hydrolase family protein [Alkalibacterium subtropicum]|uniref:Alpha/beta hydrolase family protein n=1 Tax=Alkalibacterium subtropicum TaxID=753702 RepID=A0A1I1HKI0_9LACT|nr:alpha/beta fold hydrolase [Alkalibacterium subtropicum]SFC22468.1 Alpha/beta hydrolase family protein [Alkalibacterium subtropicum]